MTTTGQTRRVDLRHVLAHEEAVADEDEDRLN
jgi:hypothetical protein